MESTARCSGCGERRVIVDPDSGMIVCTACGIEQRSSANSLFVSHVPTFVDGRIDTTVSSFLPTTGDFSSRDRKLYSAKAIFFSLASRLGLSGSRASNALDLALAATSGELACPSSNFLSALAAACCYLTARQHNLPLSLSEVASVVPCDPRDLGFLISRLTRHLDLGQLPAFDMAGALDRAIRTSPSLSRTGKMEEIITQGRFLLQCAEKWSLTTGRHPLPVVAAVAAFTAAANDAAEVTVDDMAREISAVISTSRSRYRELTETLVRVARVLLPWGMDVNAKNLVQNAPLLIRLMEMRSRSKPSENFLENFAIDTSNILDNYRGCTDEEEAEYFQICEKNDGEVDGWESVKLSSERLLRVCDNVSERIDRLRNTGEIGRNTGKRKWCYGGLGLGLGLESDTWAGNVGTKRRKSNKEMSLDQIFNIDVGYDAPPPAFTAGLELQKWRRERIQAAKSRITKVKLGNDDQSLVSNGDCLRESSLGVERRRKRRGAINGVDWEDCIIELLLLHGVSEGEIEQGQYNRLLDLYVFDSPCE